VCSPSDLLLILARVWNRAIVLAAAAGAATPSLVVVVVVVVVSDCRLYPLELAATASRPAFNSAALSVHKFRSRAHTPTQASEQARALAGILAHSAGT
jgi:hypothetical protein